MELYRSRHNNIDYNNNTLAKMLTDDNKHEFVGLNSFVFVVVLFLCLMIGM